jgi:cell division protein ZapA
MAQVTLRINGYSYVLGCPDGQEAHLLAMAAEVDQRIEAVKASAGPSGEARMLVMAALTLADDLHDLKQAGGVPAPAKPDPKLGRRLGRLAKRAEDIADGLETP